MIDWIQSLFAGISAGVGCAISMIIKIAFLPQIKTKEKRLFLTVIVLALYIGFGFLLWNIFPETPRGLAAIRGFVIVGGFTLIFSKFKNVKKEIIEIKETKNIDDSAVHISRKFLLGIIAILLIGFTTMVFFISQPVIEETPEYITIQGVQYSTMLTELDLGRFGDHSLTDEEVRSLRHMTHLTYLNLMWNEISDLTPLSNLTNLETLQLSGNAITDLTPLSELTNLTHLRLPNNIWLSDITPLSNLTNLTILNLSNCRVNDLEPLSYLTNLTTLYLRSNPINDITALSNLTNLTYVDLSRLNTFYYIDDWSPVSHVETVTGR